MEQAALQHPYPMIRHSNGRLAYGGDQSAAQNKTMRRCGCGVVGGADLLLYLHRWRAGCRTEVFSDTDGPAIPQEQYGPLIEELRRRYFPILYPFGKDGVTLAMGMNRYFRKYGIRLRARWNAGKRSLWTNMERMLREDIPVILSIGPNFPLFWQKHKLAMYRHTPDGYRPANATNSHFLMVTGMEGKWLRVSSWGQEYYIDRDEYCEYVRKHSCWLFSNILSVKSI